VPGTRGFNPWRGSKRLQVVASRYCTVLVALARSPVPATAREWRRHSFPRPSRRPPSSRQPPGPLRL